MNQILKGREDGILSERKCKRKGVDIGCKGFFWEKNNLICLENGFYLGK